MRIIFVISFLCFFSVKAQVLVDTNKLDLDYLSELLVDHINVQRAGKRLDSLGYDEVLFKAATDHAQYMRDENQLGHAQKTKLKKTPEERVIYFKGTHNYIGENVQKIDLRYELKKSKNRLTYERLAKTLSDNWKKSKPHYNNIINGAYEFAGLAITLSDDGFLYVCMVYGSKPFDPKYVYAKGSELYVKNKKECASCNTLRKHLDAEKAYLGWYTVSNDSIYYWNVKKYGKRNNLRRVFGGNGVVAIDLIHQEQYDCNGKASFHNSLYHDGYYLGYVSKKKLKNENVSPYEGIYKVFVSTKPEFLDTFYQVDFNYIRQYRPCLKNSLIFVNPDYLKPSEYFDLLKPTVDLGENLVITDSVVVRIPFERNQTDQDTTIFSPLKSTLDSLVSDNHKILNIHYTGVASIEGSLKENQKLFTKRGEIVSSYLKRYYPQYQYNSTFFENFDDFRSGLIGLGFNAMVGSTDDSLRLFANEHVGEKEVDELLNETRYSTVSVVFADYIPIKEGSYGLSIERVNDLIAENNIGELLPLYTYMANASLETDSVLAKDLLKVQFPNERKYSQLLWAQFVLDLKLNETKVNADVLNNLLNLGAIPNKEKFVEYALIFNVFYGYTAINSVDFALTINGVKNKTEKAWLQALQLISDVQTFQLSPEVAVKILYNNVLKFKFNVNRTYFICQFLIEWGYTAEPYVLLSKFARSPGQIPKLYKQYLKLGYFLKQFENPKEWKRIKTVVKILANDHPLEFCSLFRWNEMGIGSLAKQEIAELFCEKCRTQD